jgi:hypothetical protein
MSGLIPYAAEDGRMQMTLRAEQHTIWLTQLMMAEPFNATKQNF